MAPKPENASTGIAVSSPALPADIPRPARTSAMTGPMLPAAGRRLRATPISATSTSAERSRARESVTAPSCLAAAPGAPAPGHWPGRTPSAPASSRGWVMIR